MESVTKGPSIKLNDVAALEQLKNDMVKCQSVLSRLDFTSNLDSTDTLGLIMKRLPDSFQVRWTRRSSKIEHGGRATAFSDLVAFVKEETKVYNSTFGHMYAENRGAGSNPTTVTQRKDNISKQQKARVTTLATTGESVGSTAGPAPSDSSSTSQRQNIHCDNCDIAGHFIGRCYKFKKLSRDEKLDVIKRKNLCYCCLRSGHGTKDCEKRCLKCDRKHHILIHEDSSKPTSESDQSKQQKSSVAMAYATFNTSDEMDDAEW